MSDTAPLQSVVELDEGRWRAWPENCSEQGRATALRVRLWLGILVTSSSVAGLLLGAHASSNEVNTAWPVRRLWVHPGTQCLDAQLWCGTQCGAAWNGTVDGTPKPDGPRIGRRRCRGQTGGFLTLPS